MNWLKQAWGRKWLEDVLMDLRFSGSMLRKNPVLTIAAVITLALGIGANTAIFTLLYGLVLRSLPAANPWQLVSVGWQAKDFPRSKTANSCLTKCFGHLTRSRPRSESF